MPAFSPLGRAWGLLSPLVGILLILSILVFPLLRADGDLALALQGYAFVAAAIAAAVALGFVRGRGTMIGALSRIPRIWFSVGLFTLSLSLRLAALYLFPIFPSESRASDPAQTELAAWNLSQGLGYVRSTGPDVHWPPGFALFGSVVYSIAGRSWVLLAIANCLFDALTAVLTCVIGRRIWGEAVGRVSGLLYALNVYMVLSCQNLHYYSMLGFLLTLFVVLVQRPGWWIGPLLGITALVKPIALAFPAIFAGVRATAGRAGRQVARQTALAAGLMLLVISPWTVRNYVTFDSFVLIAAEGGAILWRGNNPTATGLVMDWPASMQEARREKGGIIRWDEQAGREALAWIRDHPMEFLALVPKKQAYTFGTQLASLPDLDHHGPRVKLALRAAAQLFYLVLALCAAATLLRAARHVLSVPEGLAAVLMLALLFAIHGIFPGYSAHHGPVLSLITVMAAGVFSDAGRDGDPRPRPA